MFAPGFGKFVVDEPVPSNCLWKKSKEFPVISSTTSAELLVPAISSTLGLKSYVSYKGNSPVGAGVSGSTFVAVYVGISSKSI